MFTNKDIMRMLGGIVAYGVAIGLVVAGILVAVGVIVL